MLFENYVSNKIIKYMNPTCTIKTKILETFKMCHDCDNVEYCDHMCCQSIINDTEEKDMCKLCARYFQRVYDKSCRVSVGDSISCYINKLVVQKIVIGIYSNGNNYQTRRLSYSMTWERLREYTNNYFIFLLNDGSTNFGVFIESNDEDLNIYQIDC